jgi:hypothetical protein
LLHPDEHFIILEEFVDTIAMAIAEFAATNTNTITLKNIDLLYLMEFSRIYKVGGINSPYVNMEWFGIQIPQVVSIMLNEIGLRFNFVTDTGSYEEGDLYLRPR